MVNVLNNTTNAVYIPTVVSQETLSAFKSYLNLARTVAKNTDYTTATFGQVLSIPKTGAVSANDKSQGSAFTRQNPTGTNTTVTLNKHKEVTLPIDDVTKVLENQDTLAAYGRDAAIALAEAVETALTELHPSINNTVTFDKTSDATKDASMLRIRKYFTDQKVPRTEQRYLYCDPTMFNELLEVDKYTRFDARGDAGAITQGQVIRTYGIDIHESQLVDTSGSPVAYHNLAYTRDGLILASRPLPLPAADLGTRGAVVSDAELGISLRSLFSYNHELGAHELTVDVLFGVAVLDQRRVLEVESN
ncbi:MAG: hypothetical protein MOGMAGMI_01806 [Candidatus Omnitrophica bacterium]|nr:hypothetical protein [Candidatus Omnitrophota bacterium]